MALFGDAEFSSLSTAGLSGKLVLVTGSTDGIGRAIAEVFVRAGCRVIVNSRKADKVETAVGELRQISGNVFGCVADVSTAEGCRTIIDRVDGLGSLHVLVNNVGIFDSKPFDQTTDEEWERHYIVNVMPSVRLCRYFLPKMLELNDHGRVLIVSSEVAVKPLPHMLPYSVSKSALAGLSRGLAELTRGTTVTVNTLLCGPTWTSHVEEYFQAVTRAAADNGDTRSMANIVSEYFEKNEPTSLIQRFIDLREIAAAALFLASRFGGATTGAATRVEGGIIRHI
jgi:NAD(P)-dependent dehydrogenase (short-subunit alcohol dehydrogenase family)|eukprot:gnl/Ergobibamus_cyprinoides/197.p1 GENE.gnl/Ergobibamus_cyprinoides/197~~gnl/Ergobibamus_cyprinoides/197.p1  ORF type:complete len:283 (+),score=94.66 gnl/Ergobibamus_cyprinoides/197:86-934(+)